MSIYQSSRRTEFHLASACMAHRCLPITYNAATVCLALVVYRCSFSNLCKDSQWLRCVEGNIFTCCCKHLRLVSVISLAAGDTPTLTPVHLVTATVQLCHTPASVQHAIRSVVAS
jgi:hypothetical protein